MKNKITAEFEQLLDQYTVELTEAEWAYERGLITFGRLDTLRTAVAELKDGLAPVEEAAA